MPTDLYWTLDGDLALGESGDLRDTSFDLYRSLFQEVRTRIRSSFKDWILHPQLGANLDELLGKPNSRMTAEEGKTSIISSLVMGGFLPKSAIKVRYMPLGRHWLTYSVSITIATPSGETRMLKTQLLYDTVEGEVSIV